MNSKHEIKSQKQSAASDSLTGLDGMCRDMQKMGIPVTLENYLRLGFEGRSLDELDAEELEMIPEQLLKQTRKPLH